MYFFLLGLGLAMTSLIFWFSSSVQHPWRLGLATRMLSGNCSNATKQRRKAARLDKDARIAIIGSGLGGLSAAISLEQAGFTNVVVYERHVSPSSRREGYGLTLTYNPKGPLAQMGLLDQVAQQDCPSRSHYIFSVGRVGLCCFRYAGIFAQRWGGVSYQYVSFSIFFI
jgi:Zn-dependent alcohol dehydrogenase